MHRFVIHFVSCYMLFFFKSQFVEFVCWRVYCSVAWCLECCWWRVYCSVAWCLECCWCWALLGWLMSHVDCWWKQLSCPRNTLMNTSVKLYITVVICFCFLIICHNRQLIFKFFSGMFYFSWMITWYDKASYHLASAVQSKSKKVKVME